MFTLRTLKLAEIVDQSQGRSKTPFIHKFVPKVLEATSPTVELTEHDFQDLATDLRKINTPKANALHHELSEMYYAKH